MEPESDDRRKIALGICRHPKCESLGAEASHIIWRSQSRKKCLDEPWNIVMLCADHHRLGKEAVHRSRKWREYYYRFLPSDWKRRIEECEELR
jgi:hypothetical protein